MQSLSSSSSSLLLSLLSLLCLLGSVSCTMGVVRTTGNAMIFIDNTDGFAIKLPVPSATSTDPTTYQGTGVMSFTLDWNNDQSDIVTFNLAPNSATNNRGGSISVVAMGTNATYCGASISNLHSTTGGAAGNLTLDGTHQNCSYQVTYTQWAGQASLNYNNGSTTATIDILYVPSATVVGDPQFVGLRGQSYQVHGIDGAVYNLITQPRTQVNARFVFLNQGQCPIINGTRDTNCWMHPGSYLGEMSFQQVVNGEVHFALLTSGCAESGFAGVEVDGMEVDVGERVEVGYFAVSVHSTHLVEVDTQHFHFQLSNSDRFINQALRVTVPLSKLQAHGLLGQTHSSRTYSTPLRFVQGKVDDYCIVDEDLFGTAFLYNQFQV